MKKIKDLQKLQKILTVDIMPHIDIHTRSKNNKIPNVHAKELNTKFGEFYFKLMNMVNSDIEFNKDFNLEQNKFHTIDEIKKDLLQYCQNDKEKANLNAIFSSIEKIRVDSKESKVDTKLLLQQIYSMIDNGYSLDQKQNNLAILTANILDNIESQGGCIQGISCRLLKNFFRTLNDLNESKIEELFIEDSIEDNIKISSIQDLENLTIDNLSSNISSDMESTLIMSQQSYYEDLKYEKNLKKATEDSLDDTKDYIIEVEPNNNKKVIGNNIKAKNL